MMVRALVRYYIDWWRHPAWRDFASMGVGIEARYERCRDFWTPHLRLSQGFVTAALRDLPPAGRVAILGAGRLLDVPLTDLLNGGREVHLFDIDPGCPRVWAKAGRGGALVPHIVDLTDSMSAWTSSLRRCVRTPGCRRPDVERLLHELEPGRGVTLGGFALVVSLNLLSQIPIYWRERVEAALKQLNPSWIDEPTVEQALAESCRRLQARHLELLAESDAGRVIVLTDTDFFYYRRDEARWQVEPSLYIGAVDLTGYTAVRGDSWLWHIAPQGREAAAYGSIHRVSATEFRRQ
jgi:hypothetical protein